jgi:transposase
VRRLLFGRIARRRRYLPPVCPELNAAENIWQYIRQNYLSNLMFAGYTAIVDACQQAPQRARTHRIHRDARLDNDRSDIMKASEASPQTDESCIVPLT